MKKLIISIISVAVVASLLAVAVFAFTSIGSVDADDNATLKRSTYEILSEIAETEDNTFTVSRYNQREIFSDFSPENLDQIFQALDIVISKNETLEFSSSVFFWYLFQRQGVEILSFDFDEETFFEGTGSITVSADEDPAVLKYAMLAKILLENFPDAVNYGAPNEKILSYNINLGQDIVIFFDYGEYGFESKGDYLADVKASGGKYAEGVYIMDSYDVDIYSFELAKNNIRTPNLLEKYNPVPNRIEQEIVQEELAKQKAAN